MSETAQGFSLEQSDFEEDREEQEVVNDRSIGSDSHPVGAKPRQSRHLLNFEEIARIIDGANPITVWREKRGMTVRELAASVGMPALDVLIMEKGGPIEDDALLRLSQRLDVPPEALLPPEIAP